MRIGNLEFEEKFIKKRLKSLNSPERITMKAEGFINSSILFLISPNRNKPYDLILIQRTKRLGDKHAGEMAFPGGIPKPKLDNSLKSTALRETEEELGIPRDKIHILGAFNDHLTPKKFIITPIVGYVSKNQKMTKEIKEVKEIIKIPISFFANKRNYKERTYQLHGNMIAVGKYKYRSKEGKKYIVFGATSHVIVDFLESVYGLKLMSEGCRRLCCEDLQKRDRKIID